MAFVYTYEKNDRVEYIGKAKNCRRLLKRFLEHQWHDGMPYADFRIRYIYYPNEAIADTIETDLINTCNPPKNTAKKGWGIIPLIFIPDTLPTCAVFEFDSTAFKTFYDLNGDPKKWDEKALRYLLLGERQELVDLWDAWMAEEIEGRKNNTLWGRGEAHG